MLKCNIDDTCYTEQNLVLGNVKQDEQGRFVEEYARKFEGKPNIREAEAMGVLKGLKWLQSMNMSNVQ
jgi:hypothetical protein